MSETHIHTHETSHHSASKKTLSTPIAIIIGAIIIAVGLMGYGYLTSGTTTSSAPSSLFIGKAVDQSPYIDGDKNAKVVVVEYSDPECPFCIMFHPTMKQLRSEYKGKIAFVYRNFPLTEIHPLAFDESRAISCAGKVGGVTGYYNYIMNYFDLRVTAWQKNGTNKQPPAISLDDKQNLLQTTGLDANAFNACMKNNETAGDVQDSITDGSQLDASGVPLVNGTPSTYVLRKVRKGYEVVAKVDGARPYAFVKAAIDQALAK